MSQQPQSSIVDPKAMVREACNHTASLLERCMVLGGENAILAADRAASAAEVKRLTARVRELESKMPKEPDPEIANSLGE